MLLAAGFLLIFLGVLSRLLSLEVYRRVTQSPSRDVTPSFLPGTPWATVASDRRALMLIVWSTYTGVLAGMVLVLVGALA